MVASTGFAAGSDAYAAALIAYLNLKNIARGDGLEGTLDDLGQRFVHKMSRTIPQRTEAVAR